MSEKYEVSNIIRIGADDKQKIEKYVFAIFLRVQPKIYSKEHCIKIQFAEKVLEYADVLLKKFKWIGLKEVSREKKDLQNEKEGYIIPDGYEVTLKKMGTLDLMQQDWEVDNKKI